MKLADRDLSIFETHPSNEIAKIWGVSVQYVSQIRIKLNLIKLNSRKIKKENRESSFINEVIEFAKNNIIFERKKFKKFVNKHKHSYTENTIIKIFINEKINSFFTNELAHSINNYNRKNKCVCDICKLAYAMYAKFFKHNKIEWKFKLNKSFLISYLANKYILFYENDETPRKRKFYNIIETELQKSEEELLIDIKKNIHKYINRT